MAKQGKRFKKFAHRHLGRVIKTRRQSKPIRTDMRQKKEKKEKKLVEDAVEDMKNRAPAGLAQQVAALSLHDVVVRKYDTVQQSIPDLFTTSSTDRKVLQLIHACERDDAVNSANQESLHSLFEAAVNELEYGLVGKNTFEFAQSMLQEVAFRLQNAMKQPTPESCSLISSWKYFVTFAVVASAVARCPAPKQFGPLANGIYQVGAGMLELLPSPQCYPLHLHCIGLMSRVARETKTYFPLAQYLQRIFDSKELRSHQTPQANQADDSESQAADQRRVQLSLTLRVNTKYFKSNDYRIHILSYTVQRTLEHLACYSNSIAFAEYAHPVVTAMRDAQEAHGAAGKPIRDALAAIEKHTATLSRKRRGVNFGPCDNDKIALWENDTSETSSLLAKQLTKLRSARTMHLPWYEATK